MSRKKHRSSHRAPNSETAVATAPAAGMVTPPAKAAPTSARGPERFWLEVWIVRTSRWLGSLQIAVLGLTLFAVVLAIGTMVESWYSGRVAQELVYRTWWFAALLLLLGVNIFFAAAKKWPWKKHQTGFLITHLGLITMIAGGVLTSLSGVDSMMTLIDTENERYQRQLGLPQASSQAIDRDESLIRVTRTIGGKEQPLSYSFQPGSLAWRSDEYIQRDVHPLLGFLDRLSHPLPRYWVADLGRGAELEVLGYYPHAKREDYSPAESSDTQPATAVKLSFSSPNAPFAGQIERWVASGTAGADVMGVARMEVLGKCPGSLLDAFRNPPPPKELGQKGQLAVSVAGKTERFSVDKDEGGAARPVGQTGWKVRVVRYFPAYPNEDASAEAQSPAVELELTSPAGETVRRVVMARLTGELLPDPKHSDAVAGLDDVQAWYNVPDNRWGGEYRAALQMVKGPDDRLYYRSYHTENEQFVFEKSGEIKSGETFGVWQRMGWQFHVEEYLPRAVARPRYVPINLRPGLEDPTVQPAIRCKLSTPKDAKEFWVGYNDGSSTPVTVGDETFRVRFDVHTLDLGFTVKLLHAEANVDPGTNTPATYTSYVQLTDEKEKIYDEDRMITMNHPLDHNGYKLYQSDYKPRQFDPSSLKIISYSGFTVSRDPGLWLKYAGSTMLALGIICMFYMKAYFFKPRGRKTASASP
jgi:hypothetical protein